MTPRVLNNEHNNKPSSLHNSTLYYDDLRGERTSKGNEPTNNEGGVGQQRQTQCPLIPFTSENDFAHCNQDEATTLEELV